MFPITPISRAASPASISTITSDDTIEDLYSYSSFDFDDFDPRPCYNILAVSRVRATINTNNPFERDFLVRSMSELVKFDGELNNASGEESPTNTSNNEIVDNVNRNQDATPDEVQQFSDNRTQIKLSQTEQIANTLIGSDKNETINFSSNNEIVESDFIYNNNSLVSSLMLVSDTAINSSISSTSSQSGIIENANFANYKPSPDINISLPDEVNNIDEEETVSSIVTLLTDIASKNADYDDNSERMRSPGVESSNNTNNFDNDTIVDDNMEGVEIQQDDSNLCTDTTSTDNKGNGFDDNHNNESDEMSSRIESIRQTYSEIILSLKDQLNLFSKLREILPECIRSPVERRVGVIKFKEIQSDQSAYQTNETPDHTRNEFIQENNSVSSSSTTASSDQEGLQKPTNDYNYSVEQQPVPVRIQENNSVSSSSAFNQERLQKQTRMNDYYFVKKQFKKRPVPTQNEFIQGNNSVSSSSTTSSNQEGVQKPTIMNKYNYSIEKQFKERDESQKARDIISSSAKRYREIPDDIEEHYQEKAKRCRGNFSIKQNQNQLDSQRQQQQQPRQLRIDTPGKDEREVLAVVIPEFSKSSDLCSYFA